jgi:hypothetical protein
LIDVLSNYWWFILIVVVWESPIVNIYISIFELYRGSVLEINNTYIYRQY